MHTMTVAAALEAWINKKRRTWCPKVTEHVRRLAAGWVEQFGDQRLVAEVTVADVERIEERRDDGRRSGSALNQERTYLRGFFKWCRLNEWRTSDPTVTWSYRSQEVKREYYTLTREEEERLVEASPPWLRRFVRVAICTGLREGTVQRLRWGMLSPDGILVIPAEIMKTRRDHRMPLAQRALAELGDRQPAECPLIPGMEKNATWVYKEFKKAGRRAGLPAIVSPHDLKRTWVSRMMSAGVPLNQVMALGGYRSQGIILKHYFAPVPTDEARAILEKV
jgi:integrase